MKRELEAGELDNVRMSKQVSKQSWHYWIYSRICPDDELKNPTSVCKYWGTVIISPMFAIFVVTLFVAISPLIFLGWLSEKYKWKGPSCPFGNIDFREREIQPQIPPQGGK